MNRSTSQNFNFDDAKRGEIKILHRTDGKELYINSTKVEAFYPYNSGTRIHTVSSSYDVQEDFDTILEWYLNMEGWMSYPDIDLFNIGEEIEKMNSNPLIMEVKDYGV